MGSEKTIQANGITLVYETFGPVSGPPLLLVMGLGSQMIRWPKPFCRLLAGHGLFVIRFDNRDVGLSEKIPSGKPYTLSDMAADAVGLLDGLGLARAHALGISMGGMIGQVLALEHPERIRTLTCLESTTSEPDLPPPTPEALEALMTIPPANREGYVDHMERVFKAFSGGSPLFDAELEREVSGRCFDRNYHPDGVVGQFGAITASGGRRSALAKVTTPTLVISGDRDTLLPPEHGRDIASAVPGAEFLLVEGLGHGMAYPALWDALAESVCKHIRRFEETL